MFGSTDKIYGEPKRLSIGSSYKIREKPLELSRVNENRARENAAQKQQLAIAFGQRLRRWRSYRGLTQGQLAAAAGYNSFSPISDIEKGKATPRFDKVQLLAKALEITVDELQQSDAPSPLITSGPRITVGPGGGKTSTMVALQARAEAEFDRKLDELRKELRLEIAAANRANAEALDDLRRRIPASQPAKVAVRSRKP